MRVIAPAATLTPEGAVTFEAVVRGEPRPCFALRTPHGVRGYVNICAHRNQPVLVDDRPYDASGRLECRAHGAIYDPNDGVCLEGPCVGGRLLPVVVTEQDGQLWAEDDDAIDDSIYAD